MNGKVLPGEVSRVFDQALSCELSMRAGNGPPIATPMAFLWRPDEWRFVLASGIVVRKKLDRLRQDSRVALSFSEFVGSGLTDPPAVLVQGTATVVDKVFAAQGMEDFWRMLFRQKPSTQQMLFDPEDRVGLRAKFYWRVRILVRPEKVWTLRGEPGRQELEYVA
jgi:nitroimidazol reductase NimA-like FMN-containing flavoprotein (pyridoxamine 5'-phosphate oxidase superfamily)